MATPLKIGILGLGHLHPRTYMPHFLATPDVEVGADAVRVLEIVEAIYRSAEARKTVLVK